MSRSWLTETIAKVDDLFNQINGLPDEVRLYLLDRLIPEPAPEVVKQAKKARKQSGKPREYDSCQRCGTTKRDSSHKDQSSPDYHEFQSSKPKSPRATALESQLKANTEAQRQAKGNDDSDDEDGPRCTYLMGDDTPCNTTEHSPVHKADGGYLKWHEFQPGKSAAASGD